jgi:hypothetical protein
MLIAYTDGITEVQNRQGELWGQQALEELLSSCGRGAPAQVIERVLDEVSSFADGLPQQDDMTLVVMRVHGGCEAEYDCRSLYSSLLTASCGDYPRQAEVEQWELID